MTKYILGEEKNRYPIPENDDYNFFFPNDDCG